MDALHSASTRTGNTPDRSDEISDAEQRYVAPGWFTRNIFNRSVRFLTRRGVSVLGSRELRVRGRHSGAWRSIPVNVLTVDDTRYLVAPRGVTQWVRNIRAVGGGELRVGRRVEAFRAVELDDAQKPEILRAYLRRWRWEVGVFFAGVDASATDAELFEIAGGYPVFQIVHEDDMFATTPRRAPADGE